MSRPAHRAAEERPHVALIVETSINFGRGILRGIAQFQREHGPWSVFLEQRELGAELPRWIGRWQGQGIITRSADRRLLRTGVPTVALFDRTAADLGMPRILNAGEEVGRSAVRHLRERGFQHFAFYGVREFWSQLRQQGIAAELQLAGLSFATFAPRRGARTWELQQQQLAEWIATLPKPLGLMACNDIHGLRALDACRRARLAVPEEVAVIGADNDAELCELADPPLSSIAFNPERVGYEAAALLSQLMHGTPVAPAVTWVQPLGVVTRQSTDILAIDDRDVAQALHWIRRHACSGREVADLLAVVPLSRRSLEQRFQASLGRAPHAEIVRVRIEHAKLLLTTTSLSIEAVGTQAGFSDAPYFSSAFKRAVGMNPRAFRVRHARK